MFVCVKRGLWAALLLGLALPALALPGFEAVRRAHQPSDSVLLSREGEVLQRLRTDTTVRRGEWVALPDVSAALRMALVLSEDRRFYEHSGVDWMAVSAAAWGNLWNQRTRGASTLTMQLAGLLDGEGLGAPGTRNVAQKLGQAVAAQVLERRWRKDQILEAYLNLVSFRGEIVGMDAMARSLFGKAPHGLDAYEAAVAAALVRAPNAPVARVAERACEVLQRMQQAGVVVGPGAVSCSSVELFTHSSLQQRRWPASEGVAPHFFRQWRARAAVGGALPARSSLQAGLQRLAVQALQQQLRELQGRNVEDGAIVVLDNRTGEVLAWVGSSGQLSQAAEVDGVTALRQPGSTLKPFLYGQALAERRLTAASLVEDSAAQIRTDSGLYIPQNYDRAFKGWVSVRTALASSLNVPAVRTLVMVSPDAFFTQLRALGLPLGHSGGYYGYSLALGSAEVPLLALANAYRALANGGRYQPVRWGAAAVPAPVQAMDAGAAFIVGDMLADRNARAMTFGWDSVLDTRFWSAVKTGTSKDMRDNWAVGWSQRYTVAVWVGNASGAAMHDVSGTSGAAPIWAQLMAYLHQQQPGTAPQAPAGVQSQAVRYGPGPQGTALESPRSDWFLPGTAQALFAIDTQAAGAGGAMAGGQNASNLDAARILAPVGGSILALDPDIPPQRQRLQLRASADGVRWVMDGQRLGQGRQLAWMPWPGRHVLQLQDGQGRVLDEVRLEVRGAGVRAR